MKEIAELRNELRNMGMSDEEIDNHLKSKNIPASVEPAMVPEKTIKGQALPMRKQPEDISDDESYVEPVMVPDKTVEAQKSPLFADDWADDSSDDERDETPAPAPLSFAERTAAYCPPQHPREDGFKTVTKKKTKKVEAKAKELPPWTVKANLPKVEVENLTCHIVALDNYPEKVEFSYAYIGNYRLVLINRSDETFIVVWGDIPRHVQEVSFQAKFENWTDCKIDKVPVINVGDRAFQSHDDMLKAIGDNYVTFE